MQLFSFEKKEKTLTWFLGSNSLPPSALQASLASSQVAVVTPGWEAENL